MSIITGRENIIRYHQEAAIRGLAIEVQTGMKLSNRGSGLDACRIQGLLEEGRTTRTGGLRKAVKKMKELYPGWETPESIKIALAPKAK